MKNISFPALLLAIILLGVSCTDEDFALDQNNPNGPSTDNYWINLDRVESTLAAAYSGMLNHGFLFIQGEAIRADLAYSQNRNIQAGAHFHWYNQSFDNGSRDLRAKWESYYLVIFRANQVIEALEALEGEDGIDPERWNEQMAQARFLRGLSHFYLHSLFNNGEIIIRDFVPKEVADFNKGLSSSEEVIAFFREDLMYAYEHLPAASPPGIGAYRASKGAAATALGTSYLYEEEFEEAIAMFDDVINNPLYGTGTGYQLEDPFVMFTEAGENNREAILEINYTVDVQTEDSQWDETSFNNRLGRITSPTGGFNAFFVPAAWLIDAYVNEPVNTNDSRNYVDGVLRPVPLRASAMVAVIQDTVSNYYSTNWPALVKGAFTGNNVGYWKKYTAHDLPGVQSEDDTGGTSWKGGRNATIMRLSDVYLMQAEALLRGRGDVDGALALVNAIRDRWALQLLGPDQGTGDDYDGINYTLESLMEHIMLVEKPLELSAEGHSIRNIDLRRWGIAKERYQTLAQKVYYVSSFTYQGEEKPGLLVSGAAPANEFMIDFEYDIAAANYNPVLHDYLPIPVEEERNNLGIR